MVVSEVRAKYGDDPLTDRSDITLPLMMGEWSRDPASDRVVQGIHWVMSKLRRNSSIDRADAIHSLIQYFKVRYGAAD